MIVTKIDGIFGMVALTYQFCGIGGSHIKSLQLTPKVYFLKQNKVAHYLKDTNKLKFEMYTYFQFCFNLMLIIPNMY